VEIRASSDNHRSHSFGSRKQTSGDLAGAERLTRIIRSGREVESSQVDKAHQARQKKMRRRQKELLPQREDEGHQKELAEGRRSTSGRSSQEIEMKMPEAGRASRSSSA